MTDKTILIVDDEPYVIRSLSFVLKKEGYRIETARNGKEALQKIAARRPHMVILDLSLPDMDGSHICRTVKGDPALRDIYVLILSAKGQDHDRQDALSAGADHFIGKPFSPTKLIKHLHKLFPLPPPQ